LGAILSDYRTAQDLTINCNECGARHTLLKVDAESAQAPPLRLILRCDKCERKSQLTATGAVKITFLKGATTVEVCTLENADRWDEILKEHGLGKKAR
jgi:hypothetical protein